MNPGLTFYKCAGSRMQTGKRHWSHWGFGAKTSFRQIRYKLGLEMHRFNHSMIGYASPSAGHPVAIKHSLLKHHHFQKIIWPDNFPI